MRLSDFVLVGRAATNAQAKSKLLYLRHRETLLPLNLWEEGADTDPPPCCYSRSRYLKAQEPCSYCGCRETLFHHSQPLQSWAELSETYRISQVEAQEFAKEIEVFNYELFIRGRPEAQLLETYGVATAELRIEHSRELWESLLEDWEMGRNLTYRPLSDEAYQDPHLLNDDSWRPLFPAYRLAHGSGLEILWSKHHGYNILSTCCRAELSENSVFSSGIPHCSGCGVGTPQRAGGDLWNLEESLGELTLFLRETGLPLLDGRLAALELQQELLAFNSLMEFLGDLGAQRFMAEEGKGVGYLESFNEAADQLSDTLRDLALTGERDFDRLLALSLPEPR